MLLSRASVRNFASSYCSVSVSRAVVAEAPRKAHKEPKQFASSLRQARKAVLTAAQAVDNSSSSRHSHSSAEAGMDVAELSVTAEFLKRSESTEAREAEQAAAAAAESLSKQPWVQDLIGSYKDSKLVFSADGNSAEARQHLSTGLSQDHLFLSLLQNNMIQDMVVLYAAERKIVTVLKLGVPVCGHPTIVHGGFISAIFDETFGVLLYAAGRWGHFDLTMVFTARLEVDYKKPLPAESTIVCEVEVESMEGRKIWLTGKLTDPTGDTVYAASRALFVKPKQPVSLPQQEAQADGAAAVASA